MQNRQRQTATASPAAAEPYLYSEPVIPGRPLIEGSERMIFPPFLRVESRPVTFRSADAYRTREEREEYFFTWFERVKKKKHLVMLMIPHAIYSSKEHVFVHMGWTLRENDGEIRTQQCVVFLSGSAVPIGRSDQGVICVADVDDLSAWDGRTEEQSRAQAA